MNFGWCLILIGLATAGTAAVAYGLAHPTSGWGKTIYRVWPFGQPQWVQRRLEKREAEISARMEEAARPVDKEAILRQSTVGNFVTVLGRQIQILGSILLLELKFFGADKSDKRHTDPATRKPLREFQGYSLSASRLLVEQPEGEGQVVTWFMYSNVTSKTRAVTEFMTGTPQKPGPAMKFAKSNQTADVTFEVPGLQGKWQCTDIVWADLKLSGKNVVRNASDGSMPRVAILLARSLTDAGNWLMFMDLRVGQGSDSLWIGEQFDPEVELE